MTAERPRVAIAMAWIYQYRAPFYEHLRRELDDRGVELDLYHGEAEGSRSAHTRDFVRIPWAVFARNRILCILGKELWWQPVLRSVRSADLVVVEQASSRLVNYALFLLQAVGRTKLALWGHGVDLRPGRFAWLGEGIKRWLTRRVHWMFVYNEATASIVRGLGLPAERITDVRNAIDTAELERGLAELSPSDLAGVRDGLGIDGDQVVVFCGAMYPDKRLDFVLEACELAREEVQDLHVVLVGDGEERGRVDRAAARHDWVHPVGQRFGLDRVPYFAISKVQLMPGAVGLGVLDSFALRTPMITSRSGAHGPEIAYLRDGVDGLVVDDRGDPAAYASAIVRCLTDDALLEELRRGCRQATRELSIEGMARRFADGIEHALVTDAPRWFRRAR